MRLIDADRLDDLAYFTKQPTYDAPYGGDYVVKMKDIDNAPTINPEDLRPKGKWERVIPTKSATKWSRKMSCSVCHREGYDYHKFCPNCGARMEE